MNIYRLVCAHACVCVSNGYRQTFKSQGMYVSVCLMNIIYRLACAHAYVCVSNGYRQTFKSQGHEWR